MNLPSADLIRPPSGEEVAARLEVESQLLAVQGHSWDRLLQEQKSFEMHVKAQGGPCEQGERADLTGCVPKESNGEGRQELNEDKKPSAFLAESDPKIRARVIIALEKPIKHPEWGIMPKRSFLEKLADGPGARIRPGGKSVANDRDGIWEITTESEIRYFQHLLNGGDKIGIAGTGKELWELTKDEWIDANRNRKLGSNYVAEKNKLQEQQRTAIVDALAAGKYVSPRVLEGYPDLKTEKSFKNLSWLDSNLGGALVKPPATKLPPSALFRNRLALVPDEAKALRVKYKKAPDIEIAANSWEELLEKLKKQGETPDVIATVAGVDYLVPGIPPEKLGRMTATDLRRNARKDLGTKGIGSTIESAGRWLAAKWENLENRYGRRAALGMAVAAIATFPIPGNIAAVIAAAEAIRGIHGYFSQGLYDNFVPMNGGKDLPGSARGKPCKQGQAASRTGCIPEEPSEGAPSKGPIETTGENRSKWMTETPIQSTAKLGTGVNESIMLTFENGKKGVFKPAKGEADGYRNGMKGGTYYKREVAASRVAEILGFEDLVPPTTFLESPNKGIGSVQEFVPDADLATNLGTTMRFDGPEDAMRAAIFDYIIGATDRHEENWLVHGDEGKLALIDNGLAFPVEEFGDDLLAIRLMENATRRLPVQAFTEFDKESLKGKWPELQSALEEVGLEHEAIKGVRDRLVQIFRAVAFSDLKWAGKSLGSIFS